MSAANKLQEEDGPKATATAKQAPTPDATAHQNEAAGAAVKSDDAGSM